MDTQKYNFLYCPKLVLFSADWLSILLAKRVGEADYDGTWSFVGGKLETTDGNIESGIAREKNEEIGTAAKVDICFTHVSPLLFTKKDGSQMIVAHYIAHHLGGDVVVNPAEYSEFKWVPIKELADMSPVIENIPLLVSWSQKVLPSLSMTDFTEI